MGGAGGRDDGAFHVYTWIDTADGFLSPEQWGKEKQRGDFGSPSFVHDYERDVIQRAPWAMQKVWGLEGRATLGFQKIATSLLGLAGSVSDDAAHLAGEGAEAHDTVNSGLPSTGVVGTLVEETPMIALQILVTRGLGMGAGALTKSAGYLRAAAALESAGVTQVVQRTRTATDLVSASLMAGTTSYSATLAQEASLGTPLEEARQKALRAGSNTALIAGIFGVGALGGIERAAAGRAVDVKLGDVLQLARKEAGARNPVLAHRGRSGFGQRAGFRRARPERRGKSATRRPRWPAGSRRSPRREMAAHWHRLRPGWSHAGSHLRDQVGEALRHDLPPQAVPVSG